MNSESKTYRCQSYGSYASRDVTTVLMENVQCTRPSSWDIHIHTYTDMHTHTLTRASNHSLFHTHKKRRKRERIKFSMLILYSVSGSNTKTSLQHTLPLYTQQFLTASEEEKKKNPSPSLSFASHRCAALVRQDRGSFSSCYYCRSSPRPRLGGGRHSHSTMADPSSSLAPSLIDVASTFFWPSASLSLYGNSWGIFHRKYL